MIVIHVDRFCYLILEKMNPGKFEPIELFPAMKKIIDEEEFTREEYTSIQKFIEIPLAMGELLGKELPQEYSASIQELTELLIEKKRNEVH